MLTAHIRSIMHTKSGCGKFYAACGKCTFYTISSIGAVKSATPFSVCVCVNNLLNEIQNLA